MQSHTSSTKAGRKPLPLPWGYGTMSWHGRVWWLNYRDLDGNPQFENSGTDDAREAQRMLAGRAIGRARYMVKTLERILNGQTYRGQAGGKASHREPAGNDARHERGGRSVRKNSSRGKKGGKE